MSNEFEQSGELRPGLFPEETAEEAVARIVAQNPQKHGITVQERERRAKLAAIRESRDLSGLSAEDALIVSVGGDPNETMTGNKPRWTVDGDTIKDHLEGKKYGIVAIDSTQAGLASDKAGMEEIHDGQTVVEGGHREDAAGSAEVGAEQDSAAGSPSNDVESAGTEPSRNEAGNGDAESNQSARLADDVGAEKARSAADAEGEAEPVQEVGGAAGVEHADHSIGCPHSWPEDPDEDTRCPLCHMTFADWVNS